MSDSNKALTYTGERFIPGLDGNIELEHYHRYLLAAEYVEGKDVLDIACGEGYGSFVLASNALSVVGVDISKDAVAHATRRYSQDNLKFREGNCAEIPVEDSSIDVVVSFETIEHHDQHVEMMSEISRVLKPDGLLIISSPDKAIHSDRTGANNPYHVKELYRAEFIDLLDGYFNNISEAGQRITYGSSIVADSHGETLCFSKSPSGVERSEGLFEPEYILAFASNGPLPQIKSGIFDQPIEDSQVIQVWREEVERRGAEIQKLHPELSYAQTRVAELDRLCEERAAELDRLREERAAELDRLCEERTAELDRLREEREAERAQLVEEHKHFVRQLSTQILEMRNTHVDAAFQDGGLIAEHSDDEQLAALSEDRELLCRELDVALSQFRQVSLQAVESERNRRSIEQAYDELLQSRSMRITRPLRVLKSGIPSVLGRLRSVGFSNSLHRLWRAIPFSEGARFRAKGWLFRIFPFVFRNTLSYAKWLDYSQASSGSPLSDIGELVPEIHFVPQKEFEPPEEKLAKIICFYLPQFHPIPENDEWWGKGFTEWRNVTRVSPQFPGHYQPKLPGELGFYDLRCPGVFERQIELAKIYGIEAFCFYFYWFGGKRLLETPLLNYLENPSLDLPFCLCWANENWTKRWDGLDQEMLIAQNHSEDDDMAFISYVSKYFRDSRYLTIGGRPVLLVYRPGILPDSLATTKRWRQWCAENGIGDIYLICTQSFEKGHPEEYGFDAAVEFPPNNAAPPIITDQIEGLNEAFDGYIYDWRAFVERSRNYASDTHDYKLFRGVNPGWDNDARKPGRGAIFLGATPERYGEWLSNAVSDVRARHENQDEHLVFVNAWNEWAEGAYLEPDSRYGYGYLEATRKVISIYNGENSSPKKNRVVVVSHDAHPHGAQHLALYLCKGFREVLQYEVDILLLGEGVMTPEFERYGDVFQLSADDWSEQRAKALASQFLERGAKSAICNTTVSGVVLPALRKAGLYTVSLIHELPGLIVEHSLERSLQLVADCADSIVFPAEPNLEAVGELVSMPSEKTIVRPQGVFRLNRYEGQAGRCEAAATLRRKWSLPEDSKIVLAVGYADKRKGVDLFVDAAQELIKQDHSTFFIWVGHHDDALKPKIDALIKEKGLSDNIIFPGLDFDTDLYYAGADVYALTSREDPFPLVVLEAMQSGLPVVVFSGATGVEEVVSRSGGELVAAFDVQEYARSLSRILADKDYRSKLSIAGRDIIHSEFSFRRYLFDLESLWNPERAKISVVVPNYQYEQYIEDRLDSIVRQDYPVYELVFLDDASSDNSVKRADHFLKSRGVEYTLDINAKNSGSVFSQWIKGVESCSGDLVWIAEADDLAGAEFLGSLVKKFDSEPNLVMAYCQSCQISGEGETLAPDYRDYTADISSTRWNNDYVSDGWEEIVTTLAVKNTIPNVSGVLFKREALLRALKSCEEELKTYSIAGDWRIYVELLGYGKIAYCSDSLNLHRRHLKSVTLDNFNKQQLDEIARMQALVAARFDVSAETKEKAESYLMQLRKQFGLSE